MDVEKEIKMLKEDEQSEVYPTGAKKEKARRTFNIELWPFIPAVVGIVLLSTFIRNGDGEASNIWHYWWVIFLIKPIFFGWGKGWKRSSCQKSDGFV